MKSFKDFGIKPQISSLTGDKISIERVLNREIVVTNYKIVPSTKRENSMCLHLEFKLNGSYHIIFSGSGILIQMIEKVPMGDFPFTTTIVKENGHYEFT